MGAGIEGRIVEGGFWVIGCSAFSSGEIVFPVGLVVAYKVRPAEKTGFFGAVYLIRNVTDINPS